MWGGNGKNKYLLDFYANKEALPWITILLTRHCYYDFPSFVILSQTFEIDIPQEFTRW